MSSELEHHFVIPAESGAVKALTPGGGLVCDLWSVSRICGYTPGTKCQWVIGEESG